MDKFPYQYSRTDLVEYAKKLVNSTLSKTLSIHASNPALSVVLEFPTTDAANSALEAFEKIPLLFKELPEDTQEYQICHQ